MNDDAIFLTYRVDCIGKPPPTRTCRRSAGNRQQGLRMRCARYNQEPLRSPSLLS